MDFRDVKIGEFANVLSGYAFKSKEFTENGIPIIKIKNIRAGSVDLDNVQFVDESYLDLDQKYHVKKGDLLISLTGSHLTQPNSVVGRVARYSGPNALLNQRAGKIIFEDENICDRKFLYYLLSSLEYKRKLALFASGAASQANISPSQVESLEVKLPDFETQKEIASILSTFDDLIENNTRRIEILEEMARRIYREWFVHFRYPGHENDTLVDSGTELGAIPEGWEVKPIDDVIDAMGGGTPRTKIDEYWEGGDITWFTPSDLTSSGQLYMSDSGRKITDEGLDNSSAKMFPPYSVMMTSRATLGVIAFNTVPASVNQGFIVCIPNEKVSAYQIYFWLQEKLPSMINQASGATYKEIRKTDFRKMSFPVIEKNLHEEFVDKVEPLFKQVENLEKKNKKLKETRDLLLPKLISGKVEVKKELRHDTQEIQ